MKNRRNVLAIFNVYVLAFLSDSSGQSKVIILQMHAKSPKEISRVAASTSAISSFHFSSYCPILLVLDPLTSCFHPINNLSLFSPFHSVTLNWRLRLRFLRRFSHGYSPTSTQTNFTNGKSALCMHREIRWPRLPHVPRS